jgi:hypothetical protein
MEPRFKAEMKREETARHSDVPVSSRASGVQVRYNSLKRRDPLWTMRLLSTAVLVTRTPLTTLKSLLKANVVGGISNGKRK